MLLLLLHDTEQHMHKVDSSVTEGLQLVDCDRCESSGRNDSERADATDTEGLCT